MSDCEVLIKETLRAPDLRGRDAATARLAALPEAGAALKQALSDAVTRAEDRGWQPADLDHHLTRFRSPVHAAALTAETFDAWRSATRQDPFEAITVAIETLQALQQLPRIAKLRRTARASAHPALKKIRALLAKAESTAFPAEAEALVSRAQQLMTRYSIASVHDDDTSPTGMRLPVDGPYEDAKATLLHVVADANRCRSIWHDELGFSTVLGYPADLDVVELLYTSLLVQADTAMPKNGSRKRFRQAFLTSFAHRVAERLTTAASDEITDDLLPALARRDAAVDSAVERLFPGLRTVRQRSITDLDGWEQGRKAADTAELG